MGVDEARSESEAGHFQGVLLLKRIIELRFPSLTSRVRRICIGVECQDDATLCNNKDDMFGFFVKRTTVHWFARSRVSPSRPQQRVATGSTKTKTALQLGVEWPPMNAVIPEEFSWVLVKGRGNYVLLS